MLSFGLDASFGSFPTLSMASSTIICSKSAQTLTSRCFSSARSQIDFLYTCSSMQPQILQSTGFKSGLHAGHKWGGMKSGVALILHLCRPALGVRFFMKHSVLLFFALYISGRRQEWTTSRAPAEYLTNSHWCNWRLFQSQCNQINSWLYC